jgi:hypothetical protein
MCRKQRSHAMIFRCITAGTLALFSTAALPASQAPPAISSQTTTVLVGCLYREIQVTGNSSDYDDYILADATTPAAGTSGIVPTTGNMYEVVKASDFRVEGFVGMRVELTGRIRPNGSGVSDQTDLPEFNARAIQAVPGTCPPTPVPRK